MTGSVQLAFANNQSVTLPNDTASHTVDLSDTIDQGAPQVPVHGTTALSQDIGNGGLVPINASVVFPSSAGAATYRFKLLTSADNATWVTLSERIYTDSTGDMWDNMVNAPYDTGRMPGGWRFPSLSSPDPVTVSDAITNQFPPIVDEMPNFMPLMN